MFILIVPAISTPISWLTYYNYKVTYQDLYTNSLHLLLRTPIAGFVLVSLATLVFVMYMGRARGYRIFGLWLLILALMLSGCAMVGLEAFRLWLKGALL
jgi:hypothetical protein